ncbi:FtsX-like permease family protein [Ureibacillus sp. NPDC094379]
MRKNVKHYYLYFFALIFSVTLCFSFTSLKSNPTVVKALEDSGTATAGFEAGTYVLYFIVTFFVLYANQLFMKGRKKEIGLYQLIGMRKGLIVRLISIENIILFILAVCIGMLTGFLSSRLFAMVLMRLLEIEVIVELTFSKEAFKQSAIIFLLLLIIVLLQMVWMIRRVTLLSLFNASKKADERIRRFSIFHMAMGGLGLLLIFYGYYQSTCLFDVEKSKFDNLFLHMFVILGSTILGTFLFFRYSVALIMNIMRARKNGHLNVTDVLAVTPIMHRMKGNAKSLTLITILTGLSVGITSLSYIGYYSSEESARQASPYDFILLNHQGLEFLDQLQSEGIESEQDLFRISEVTFNIKDLVDDSLKDSPLFSQGVTSSVIPISDFRKVVPNVELKEGEAFLTSYANLFAEVLPLQKEKDIVVNAGNIEIPLFIKDIREDYILSNKITYGSPVLVVPDDLFEKINKEADRTTLWRSQIGINVVEQSDLHRAEQIFVKLTPERTVYGQKYEDGHQDSWVQQSYKDLRKEQIATIGTTVFITAFLGLAFLLTTGSILYFKQMAEAEDEKESYKILRKIGFSTSHLMSGIYAKQAFNFGVPLIIGLLHSYFAVKSGWFLFGTELVTPLVVTMFVYVGLYTIFAILSTQYYKKVINSSL